MITVNAHYHGTSENLKSFIGEIKASNIISQAKQIEGNIHFDFYESLSNPCSIILVDKWDTMDAQDTYHTSKIFKLLVELRYKYDLEIQVEKHID